MLRGFVNRKNGEFMKKENELKSMDVLDLSNQLIYQRHQMNKSLTQNFFQELSIPEYMALHLISQMHEEQEKIYLKELAEKMHLAVRYASRLAQNLKDRGLVIWSHDGNGSEGTYMILTDFGRELLTKREAVLKEYFEKVIGRFGKDNLIQMLELMRNLDEAINQEFFGGEELQEV